MDDAELLNDAPIASKMVEFLRGARDTGRCLVAADTTEDLGTSSEVSWSTPDGRGAALSPSAPAPRGSCSGCSRPARSA
jgi:hypothetical protein